MYGRPGLCIAPIPVSSSRQHLIGGQVRQLLVLLPEWRCAQLEPLLHGPQGLQIELKMVVSQQGSICLVEASFCGQIAERRSWAPNEQ